MKLEEAPAETSRPRNVFWVVLILNALLLAPLLFSAYWSDDTFNSQIRGILIQHGMGLWQFTGQTILDWMRGLGRVLALAFLVCYTLFYYCQSLFVYKFVVYIVALADVWVFYLLVKQIGKSTPLALLSAALFPLFVQFRAAWDPLLSFSCLYPLLALLLFTSLLLFSHYLENASLRLLGLSAVLFCLSTLMFEVAFPLGVLYVILCSSGK